MVACFVDISELVDRRGSDSSCAVLVQTRARRTPTSSTACNEPIRWEGGRERERERKERRKREREEERAGSLSVQFVMNACYMSQPSHMGMHAVLTEVCVAHAQNSLENFPQVRGQSLMLALSD